MAKKCQRVWEISFHYDKQLQDYGADPIRLAIIISAELLQDADFNLESVSGGIKNKLEVNFEECSRLKPEAQLVDSEAEDKWIASRLQNLIANVTGSIEKMRLREALHEILFAFEGDLQWYLKTSKSQRDEIIMMGILHQIFGTRVQCYLHLHHTLLKRCGRSLEILRWYQSLAGLK